MPCKLHRQRVSSCAFCSSEHALTECLLSLGPRSVSQFKALATKCKAKRIPPSVVQKNGMYMHKVHSLAEFIYKASSPAVHINALPGPREIGQMLETRKNDPFIKERVQFLPHGVVRQRTPLGIYDKASLRARVYRKNIAGIPLVEVAGEYEGACIDLLDLVSQDVVFTDNTTVWSKELFPAHNEDVLKKWKHLVSCQGRRKCI